MSHLHFDHAGGLLRADGSRAFPRARIVAQRAEWEVALGGQPAARRLATSSRSCGWSAEWGARGLGGRRAGAAARASPSSRRAAIRRATRRSSSRAGRRRRTLGVLRRPVHAAVGANPRWVTAFDDFPLDSVALKAELFAQAADEDWLVVLSHEREQPVGTLVPRSRPFPVRADLAALTGSVAAAR